jgi:hypothetical protein
MSGRIFESFVKSGNDFYFKVITVAEAMCHGIETNIVQQNEERGIEPTIYPG